MALTAEIFEIAKSGEKLCPGPPRCHAVGGIQRKRLALGIRALRIFLVAAAGFLASPVSLVSQEAKRPLTVVDAIESTQLLHDYGSDPVLLSPDGKKYLIVLQHGDMERNGSWVELLSGSTATLDAASEVSTVVRLFTRSTAQVGDLIKGLRWLDDQHAGFLWDDGGGMPQLVSLNLRNHQLRTLVRHSKPIIDYDATGGGQTIVFTAEAPHDLSKLPDRRHKGVAITNQDVWALLRGDLDGWTPRSHYETFVKSPAGKAPRKVVEPVRTWAIPPELLQLSPNGHYAIAVRPAGEPPTSWNAYTDHLFKDLYLPPARQDPTAPNWIRQYVLIDIQHAIARPLWDAPQNPFGQVVWSRDSRSVVVGPTFLPLARADAAGLAGRAVAEVDVATGNFCEIPLPINQPEYGYRAMRWTKDDTIEVADAANWHEDKNRLYFEKTEGAWRWTTGEPRNERQLSQVRFELRQDPNTPPALYAIDASTGRKRMIRDLNPQLMKDVSLARVEQVHWKATDGKSWTGMLYYPVDYKKGLRYPFVVQTHGYSANEFSLDGGLTTVFAAQPLANRDIAVLQVGGPDDGEDAFTGTPREPPVFMAGFEGAIEEFVSAGLADREKVGIIGFSRTGWLVEYMLTHSQIRLAAAEVADNVDGSYFQYVLGDGAERAFDEGEKGAPFGKGLETWSHEAPGFNADKVHTPLRLELDSGPSAGVLLQWEMFSNLRHLGKPAELFVIPDIEHGVHNLQNPAQRLASQGGTVDWFTFWLKSEEDPDPAKAPEYFRWRQLRKLQQPSENGRVSGDR